MGFRLYPIEITCNATLSTSDSNWGANDGIRFYLLLTTSGGFYQLMISGREFPPPDLVDSYSFVAGTQLDLSQYPPEGAPNWFSNDIVLGPSDFISLVLLGINEGLPYVSGGGGHFGGSAAGSGFYEAQKSLSGKLADAVRQNMGAGFVTDAVFEAFKSVIDQLNSAPDCRGVAFAHGVVLNRKTLLHHTLTSTGFQLVPMVDEVGLATALQVKQGCGKPDYYVPVRVWRTFGFSLDFRRTQTAGQVISDYIIVTPTPRGAEVCKPQGTLTMWVEADDYEIEVVPSVWYLECSPYWTVNGIPLRENSGTLAVPVVATIYREQGGTWTPTSSEQNVTVGYEHLQDPDGTTHLRLQTRGADGDYSLTVGVHFSFEGTYDNGHPVGDIEVVSARVDVAGQVWSGNATYQAYAQCLSSYWSNITQRLVNIGSWLGPLPPGPLDIGAAEQEVILVSGLLEQVVSRIGGQVGEAQGYKQHEHRALRKLLTDLHSLGSFFSGGRGQ